MQHETAPLFDRTAAHHGAITDGVGNLDEIIHLTQIKLVDNVSKAQIGQFVVDHQPHCALFAMADQQDDAFCKAFIIHVRHGNEELSFKRFHNPIVGGHCGTAKLPVNE